jgi:pilus assembly protein Flp/PilA
MKIIAKALIDNRGATTIEYALVAMLVAIAVLTSLQTLGSKVQTSYSNLDQAISAP